MILNKKLSDYTRAELDALALILTVDPEGYDTKAELQAVIEEYAAAAGIILGPLPELGTAEPVAAGIGFGGDPRQAGTADLPKVYVIDGQAYLFFGRPVHDHSWTDPDGKEHVAVAKEQRNGHAVKLGPVVSMNVPGSKEIPEAV